MKLRTSITIAAACACTVVIAIATAAQGQSKTDAEPVKYWIVFNDKDAGLGKGPMAVEPGFVTERALKRRQLRGRPGLAARDTPVSPSYVESLHAMGVDPIVESRWMNAVSANLTPTQRHAVEQLSFVHTIKTVAVSVEESAPVSPVIATHQYSAGRFEYGASENQLAAINAIDPIEEGLNGTGILLGFLDTTTDTLHPAMKHLADDGRIVAVRDFPSEAGLSPQSNRHGLNTSTVALGFDEGELIGACYGAEYIFGTTEYAPTETNQEEDFFVAGMEWMERMGADIVNVSLGYSDFDAGQRSYTYEDIDGDTPTTTRAADLAAGLGVVVVTSAGNEGCSSPDNCWYYVTSPADGDSVIAAGASDFNLGSVSFSGAGPTFDGRIKPDVSAPGVSVRFGSSSGGYSSGGGTSFSSPLIASVACQILQTNPSLNPIQVRDILRSTAHQASRPDNKLGWGVINAKAATELTQITVATEHDELPGGVHLVSVYPNPVRDQAIVSVELPEAHGEVDVALFDVLGRQVARAHPTRVGTALSAAIDVRDLPAGTYFVRVVGDRIDATQSLVVTD